MKTKFEHISSLIGRVFLIASFEATNNWNGNNDNGEENDYELLEDNINYEGEISLIKKQNLNYYIFHSMSSKIEIFKKENSFLIFEGLYINKSFNYTNDIKINILYKLNINFEVEKNLIYIFDSALNGKQVIKNEWKDKSTIKIEDGIYNIYSIEGVFFVENEEIILNGVMIDV